MTYSNSNTPTLNIIDINNFLFESNDNNTSKMSHSNSKSNEFNFVQVWEEIDAAALAINEQSHCSSSKKVEMSSLSALIGDITPAAAAVAAAGESPLMNTPYLDSCMSTPFTPASVFTPSLAQFQNSPYYSPYLDSYKVNDISQNDDIQVAKYLKNDMVSISPSWHTPATISTDLINTPAISSTDVSPELLNSIDTFNGDPSQLLLDTTSNNITATTTDESSDFLFPPLPSDQQQPSYQLNTHVTPNEDLFNTEDFDAGNFLDDCFDDCFLPIQQDETSLPPKNDIVPVHIDLHSIDNKKRKNKDDSANKKNKRVKVSSGDDAERKFECDICHALFNRRYNLGTHIKTHDKNRSKDFSCHLCMKPFDRKHDLTRHIATVHNGERAYSCTQCTSTFSRKDALVRHNVQKHQA